MHVAATTAPSGSAGPGEGVDDGWPPSPSAAPAGGRRPGPRRPTAATRASRAKKTSAVSVDMSVILSAAPGDSFRAVDILVDAGWLAAHRDDVVVADVRWYLDGRSGLDAYTPPTSRAPSSSTSDRDLSGPGAPTDGPPPPPVARGLRRGDGPPRHRRRRRRRGLRRLRRRHRRAAGVDAAGDGPRRRPARRRARGVARSGRVRARRRRSPAAPFTARPWPAAALATPTRWRRWRRRARPPCSTPAPPTATAARPSRSIPAPATSPAPATPPGRTTSTRRPGASSRRRPAGPVRGPRRPRRRSRRGLLRLGRVGLRQPGRPRAGRHRRRPAVRGVVVGMVGRPRAARRHRRRHGAGVACSHVADQLSAGAATLRSLRGQRRRNRVRDLDWFEAAYRAYLTGIVGLVVVLVLSSWLGDKTPSPAGLRRPARPRAGRHRPRRRRSPSPSACARAAGAGRSPSSRPRCATRCCRRSTGASR